VGKRGGHDSAKQARRCGAVDDLAGCNTEHDIGVVGDGEEGLRQVRFEPPSVQAVVDEACGIIHEARDVADDSGGSRNVADD
jgi:hypothetical protein